MRISYLLGAAWHNLHANISRCLQLQLLVVASVCIWMLGESKLQAAPENFNPGLRLPPPLPSELNPPSVSKGPVQPVAVLENLQTDFRDDSDNFGQHNQFVEPTVQWRLRNGNKIRFKTGFDSFDQRHFRSVTNIPLQIGWEGKINSVTVQAAVGVDLFNRLPTAPNFDTQIELPIALKTTPKGNLRSGVVISGVLEQGPYKFNAQTLENHITAWRLGPNLFWQIDRNTSLFSSFRLGDYSDGNYEQQSFSRLEHKFGQFSVAANLFTWNYKRDLEHRNGYFSPPDFLDYNGELAWEGDIFKFLRCRLATSLGRQRLKGHFSQGNVYQTRCTAKLSPNVDADFGYAFSNVRNRTGGSAYNNNSFTGQLRINF